MAKKVLLGFGGNVDVEVAWDAAVMSRLVAEHGITDGELDVDVAITDDRSLVVSILALMRAGSGGERFVEDPAVFDAFPTRFTSRTTLGGTGVRAALAMHTLGLPSTVHLVSTNETVRRLMPDTIERIGSATHDSTHPHLIVQYPAGAVVRGPGLEVVAPRANRLIYVNDPPNRDLVLSDELDEIAPHLGVLLVSGLNSMRDARLLEDRLGRVARTVQAMPADGIVLFEDAGHHVAELGARVHEVMAGLADVVSMNEDELFGHVGRTFDLLDPGAVEEALQEALRRTGARNLLVHTQHWAAAVGHNADALRAALRSGIVTAGTRYLVGDAPTAEDYRRTAALPVQAAGSALAAEIERRLAGRAVCLPALRLETATPTTIGLGDSFVGGLVASLARDRVGISEGAPT